MTGGLKKKRQTQSLGVWAECSENFIWAIIYIPTWPEVPPLLRYEP